MELKKENEAYIEKIEYIPTKETWGLKGEEQTKIIMNEDWSKGSRLYTKILKQG